MLLFIESSGVSYLQCSLQTKPEPEAMGGAWILNGWEPEQALSGKTPKEQKLLMIPLSKLQRAKRPLELREPHRTCGKLGLPENLSGSF